MYKIIISLFIFFTLFLNINTANAWYWYDSYYEEDYYDYYYEDDCYDYSDCSYEDDYYDYGEEYYYGEEDYSVW